MDFLIFDKAGHYTVSYADYFTRAPISPPGKRRQGRMGNLAQHAHDLASIAEFIVIPDINHTTPVPGLGRQGIDDTGITHADEVAGGGVRSIGVTDLLLQIGVHGHVT